MAIERENRTNLKVKGKEFSFWVSVELPLSRLYLPLFYITGADLTTWQAIETWIVRAVSNPYVVVPDAGGAFYNAIC